MNETTAIVPIASLLPADSPRLTGEDAEHVHLLATIESRLPPIVVHRSTMRVIDGMHRLAATLMRDEDVVAVEYFDGSVTQAFIRAVEANVSHGLPLSRADREAAVRRIIASHPQWSDRAIAAVTGLSAPSVGNLRQRANVGASPSDIRIGRDGRVRPLSSAEGRRRASEMINERPEASLREIAKASGVSVGTAHDVRERMRRGDDPLPARFAPTTDPRPAPKVPHIAPDPNPQHASGNAARLALHNLRKDPSLRFSLTGRSLLQWLGVYLVTEGRQEEFVRSIPEHCTGIVADLAWGCARIWKQIAEGLEERRRNMS
jgi:hypothetical protein